MLSRLLIYFSFISPFRRGEQQIGEEQMMKNLVIWPEE